MRLIFLLWTLYCVLNCISAFNFFPKYAQVFSDSKPGSYFGYSVLLQAEAFNSPARVVIGAPRSNSTYAQLSGIPEPGAVYSCSINEGKCSQFVFDLNGNKMLRTGTGQQFFSRRDNGWLGGAVDGQDVANGKLVACAPRWINEIHKLHYYLQNGLCYYLQDSANIQKIATKTLYPLISQANQGYRTNESVYYYALGEAGMSVHFAKNNTELLFGAPGVLQWQGMIGKYHDDQFKTLNVPNPHHVPRLQDFSYFGYSVSSGKFNKSSNEIWYVGGAPRGRNLFGQVLVYDYGEKQDELKIFYEMSGRQEGEYFGAAVAVGDVNGDGADDVIVGSPMYSTGNHYDVGCVAVYINHLDIQTRNFERTILSPSPANGIRFGTAVSVIGDVNKDGYADLAVGAPYYNNGQGAIFIYLGSNTGISEQYSQRILASDVSDSLRGFGSSFSRGVDIDNNNYNDLAVGSFLSSHAVLLKTRPVVSIHPVLKSKRTQISTEVKAFKISACVRYTGAHLPAMLNVRITINADDFYKRVSFKDSRGTMWEVVKDNRYRYNQEACDEFDVIVVNMQSDFTQPIVFKMTYELIEPTENGFCATCPVVDKRLLNYTTLSVVYETGCGSDDDNTCRPNLKLAAQFNYNKKHLVIGEDEKVDVSVNIRNFGDPAFACKFYAEIPTMTNFVKIPDTCQHVTDKFNVLLCDMGNPVKRNDMKSLLLPLDVSLLGNNDRLIVKLNVTSAGEEVDASDNSVVLELSVTTEVRISVIGISNPEQFNFIENEELKQDNFTFTHQYTVQNLGPSPLDDLELTFWIPQSFSAEENNVVQVYKPEVQVEGTTMTCRSLSPEGFHVEAGNTPTIIEADDPTAAGSTSHRSPRSHPPPAGDAVHADDPTAAGTISHRSPRSHPPPAGDAVHADSAEDLTLPLDNPTVYTRVQKLIASDRELPEDVQENRTLALGCGGDKEVHCMEVRCTSGVLRKNSRAVVSFKLMANLTVLDEKRGDRDTIVITSSVQPASKHFTVNKTYTHTILQGNVRQENPWKWIILGLILGIILLFVIIYALYRAGFFRRTEHEKLMNEKDDTFGEELSVQTD